VIKVNKAKHIGKGVFALTAILGLSSCGGSSDSPEPTTPPVDNTAPSAGALSIVDDNGGTVAVGDVLTGHYMYSDADSDEEGESELRWLRGDDVIAGTASESYQVQESDIGATIYFEVRPIASTGVTDGNVSRSSGLEIPANFAPVADAGDDINIVVGAEATFDGSGSVDSDGTIDNYMWSNGLSGVAPSLVYDEAGRYVVTLTVEDNLGATSTAEVIVNVTAEPNLPPVANAGADMVIAPGDTAMFNASLSDDSDGEIDRYEWSNGLSGINPSRVYPDVGEFDVVLTVTDNDGARSMDTVMVSVVAANVPPVASLGSDRTVTVGDTVVFDGSGSSDTDGMIESYLWSDGSTEALTSVTYDSEGMFTVSLTVTDNDGAATTGSVTVTVSEAIASTKVYVRGLGYPTPYVHYFSAEPARANSEWPGQAMEDVGNGIYAYDFAGLVSSAGMVFSNNGSGQSGDLTFAAATPCYDGADEQWKTLTACENVVPAGLARTAFVHLFEWRWSDVATECEQFLGPKGFSAVQISPPAEHKQGSQWWTRYQHVSYQLESRGGSRAEFSDMVQRCKAVDVEIYVDAVFNQMAGGSGTGVAGSTYTGRSSYPNYSEEDFNEPNCDIQPSDYGDNANNVRNCAIPGLPDLETRSEHVRATIANYLNDTLSLGVTGFRIDAAKHMFPADLASIYSRLDGNPYFFQEVINVGNQSVKASEYTPMGDVTEFNYSASIGWEFKNGKLSSLNNYGPDRGFMSSSDAVVFTDNHDNQRGHGAGGANVITFKDAGLYDLANVFMLAWPYGYPKIMSSYEFGSIDSKEETDKGGPTFPVHNNDGTNECFDQWKCEHRWRGIANTVAFRNHTAGNWFVTDWWSNDNNQIAFGRGNLGFVVINREGSDLERTFVSSLPAGNYCNTFDADFDETTGVCDGETVLVGENGEFTATVESLSALILHVGAIDGQITDNGHGNTATGN